MNGNYLKKRIDSISGYSFHLGFVMFLLKKNLEHLRALVQTLRDNKLYIIIIKCEFLNTQLLFFRFKIGADGISADESKVEVIK